MTSTKVRILLPGALLFVNDNVELPALRLREWPQARSLPTDPAFDLPVEVRALADCDDQAAVVVGAHVLPDGPGVVPFEHGPVELCRPGAGNGYPELLRGGGIRCLMNVYAEAQARELDSGCFEEAQEELDQPRVAVDEDDALGRPMRFALRTLTPVGDRASDEELALGQLADLGGGRGPDRLALGFPDRPLGGPVPAGTLGGSFPGLLVAEPRWDGACRGPRARLNSSRLLRPRLSPRSRGPFPVADGLARAGRPWPGGGGSTRVVARRAAPGPGWRCW